MDRINKLRVLKKYFLDNLVEDPIDGTKFDCDVLDALCKLEERYEENKNGN